MIGKLGAIAIYGCQPEAITDAPGLDQGLLIGHSNARKQGQSAKAMPAARCLSEIARLVREELG